MLEMVDLVEVHVVVMLLHLKDLEIHPQHLHPKVLMVETDLPSLGHIHEVVLAVVVLVVLDHVHTMAPCTMVKMMLVDLVERDVLMVL